MADVTASSLRSSLATRTEEKFVYVPIQQQMDAFVLNCKLMDEFPLCQKYICLKLAQPVPKLGHATNSVIDDSGTYGRDCNNKSAAGENR